MKDISLFTIPELKEFKESAEGINMALKMYCEDLHWKVIFGDLKGDLDLVLNKIKLRITTYEFNVNPSMDLQKRLS